MLTNTGNFNCRQAGILIVADHLADVNMPNLDGFHLVEMMNQKDILSPVVFLTVRKSLEDERRGLELGAMDYIRKPIKKDILALRVQSAIEKSKRV